MKKEKAVKPKPKEHKYFNKKIIIIKALNDLTNNEIGELTGYSGRTISSWVCHYSSDGYRTAPEEAYNKLIIKYKGE